MDVTDEMILRHVKREFVILQLVCFGTWMSNVIFMIFGIVFVHELGISISGIFLFNLLVISFSFVTSSLFNRASDKIKQRKKFILLAYSLRSSGVFLLAFCTGPVLLIFYYMIISLLNPISFEVAIIYELGEKIEFLEVKLKNRREGNFSNTKYYLRYRMFGSLGWAVMAPLAGWGITVLNDSLSGTGIDLPGFRIFFIIAAGIYLAATFIYLFTYDEKTYEQVIVEGKKKESPIEGGGMGENVKNHSLKAGKISMKSLKSSFILLLVTMFIYQAGSTLFQTPYSVFLKDFSQGSLILVGISYFISAIPEAPLFMVAFKLINKRGYEFTLSLSFILEISRIFLTLMVIPLNIAVLVLPLQSMNSFSLRWPSLTHGISHELSPGSRATGMNLDLVLEKAGGFIGSVLGAFLAESVTSGLDKYLVLFTISLVFIISNTLIFIVGSHLLYKRKEERKNRKEIQVEKR
ncbi:MAG: MFS transporter [Promethearchaeota archaeon]